MCKSSDCTMASMAVLAGSVFQTLQVQVLLYYTSCRLWWTQGDDWPSSFPHPDNFSTLRMTLNLNASEVSNDQSTWGFGKMEELQDRLTGGGVTTRPALPSKWVPASLTSPQPILIYTWYFIISKVMLKEIASASTAYHHPRHVIMSQKYMACHVLLLKYRPEMLV